MSGRRNRPDDTPADTDDTTVWVAGFHAVRAALKQQSGAATGLWIQANRRDTRMRAVLDLAARAGIAQHAVSRAELDRRLPGQDHQGVILGLVGTPPRSEADLLPLLAASAAPSLVLALDGIQDPHNLGACLRSADALGVQAVIAPIDQSVGLTPIVRKVASGAAESVPFFPVVNLQRTLRRLQEAGLWVYGAAAEADARLDDCDLAGPVVLVMGAEQSGLRRLTREACDVLFRIPMSGQVSSLNVSVATGIGLYEVSRQRAQATPRAASVD